MDHYKKYSKYKQKYFELKYNYNLQGGNNNKSYQEILYEIAKFIKPHIQRKFKNKFGMKQLSNQVIELNKMTYFTELHNNITNYYITDKLDGKRTILYLTSNKSYAINDVLTELDIKMKDINILDTEMYEGNYYIFDVMVYEGKSIINLSFEERIKYFYKFSDKAQIKTKQFIKLNDKYKDQICNFKKEKKVYDVDGIILNPAKDSYNTMKVYKYKPPEQLTIDFLIKKCPIKLQKEQFTDKKHINNTLYILFCGINKRVFYKLNMKLIKYYEDIFSNIDTKKLPQYFPIQFQPSSKKMAYLFWNDNEDLDGKVGEFLYNIKKEEWILKKIREDRQIDVEQYNYFGNNYKIAEFIWMAYLDPLIIEDIKDDNIYFQEHNNIIQKASRNFNSFVKSEIFKRFKNTNWVVDLASGKGQDLFRYITNNMHNIIFLERDKVALAELISRKHSFTVDEKIKNNTNILIQNVDLFDNYKDNIEKINNVYSGQNIDLIMCNLAFHYLMKNKKSLQNICKLIDHYLKQGGHFVFCSFDGHKIINLLKANNGEWTIKVNNDIKYSIKKKYKNNKITSIGQKIDVLLPFSKNTYYEEYLINIDTIKNEFNKYNIILVSNESFSKYLTSYNGYLDKDDQIYVDLYHYYIFTKK